MRSAPISPSCAIRFRCKSSAEVAEKLAKQAGIICIPGAYFGDSQQNYLRFAFANADVETIGAAGRTFEELFRCRKSTGALI